MTASTVSQRRWNRSRICTADRPSRADGNAGSSSRVWRTETAGMDRIESRADLSPGPGTRDRGRRIIATMSRSSLSSWCSSDPTRQRRRRRAQGHRSAPDAPPKRRPRHPGRRHLAGTLRVLRRCQRSSASDDLGSTNGTFVNGSRVRKSARLKDRRHRRRRPGAAPRSKGAFGNRHRRPTGPPTSAPRASRSRIQSAGHAVPPRVHRARKRAVVTSTSLYRILTTIGASENDGADAAATRSGASSRCCELDFGSRAAWVRRVDDLRPVASLQPRLTAVSRRSAGRSCAGCCASPRRCSPTTSRPIPSSPPPRASRPPGRLRIACAPVPDPRTSVGVLYVASRGVGQPLRTR